MEMFSHFLIQAPKKGFLFMVAIIGRWSRLLGSKAPERGFASASAAAGCKVCLDLRLDTQSRIGSGSSSHSWYRRVKDDLTLEYCLSFTSENLRESASAGCGTCRIIRDGLGIISRNLRLFDDKQAYQGRFLLQLGCALQIDVLGNHGRGIDDELQNAVRVQFFSLEGSQGIPQSSFGVARAVPCDISVERCTSIVNEWIIECRSNHKLCPDTALEWTQLPSRVLDIHPRLGPSVVLVECQNLENQRGRYATLSHCWGTSEIIKTTRASLQQRKLFIGWEELPRTFQDAITLVRALGLQYIWIDSICIVQDDQLDWKRESTRMASVYSNSYLNIAATGASNGHGGCFAQRSLRHISGNIDTGSFLVNKTDNHQPDVFVRPSFDPIHHRYSARIMSESNPLDAHTTPLLSRAWIFQERNLAPRTVHFHPSEMIMECKSDFFCECTGLDKVVARSGRDPLDLDTLGDDKVLDQWQEVVEHFSSLRLTYESDRLPALLGVATVYQNRLKCKYLAGIWEVDLARGLLWDIKRYKTMQHQKCTRVLHQAAPPTWSWASLTLHAEGAAVIFPAGHDSSFEPDKHFSFEKTSMSGKVTEYSDCDHVDKDGSAIWIRSLVVSATLIYPQTSDVMGKKYGMMFDQTHEDMILINTVRLHLDVTCSLGDACPVEEGAVVLCSLVGTMEVSGWDNDESIKYQRLLICKPSTLVENAYERIGAADVKEGLQLFVGAERITQKLV